MKRRVIGLVVSDKMTKTIRVSLSRRVKDTNTGKIVVRQTVCFAHDEKQEAKQQDTVELIESKPISKHKHWSLVRVISKNKG